MTKHENYVRILPSSSLRIGEHVAILHGGGHLSKVQIVGLHKKQDKTLIIYKFDDRDVFGVLDPTLTTSFVKKENRYE